MDLFNSQEANVYIANIIDKYGAFHFAKPNKRFEPEMLHEYITQLIPGAVQASNTSFIAYPSYRADAHSTDESSATPKLETLKTRVNASVSSTKSMKTRQRKLFELKSAPSRRMTFACDTAPVNDEPLTVDLTFTDDENTASAASTSNLKRTATQASITDEPNAKHARHTYDDIMVKSENIHLKTDNSTESPLNEVPTNELSYVDGDQSTRLENLKLNIRHAVLNVTTELDSIFHLNETLKKDLQLVKTQREADNKQLTERNVSLLTQLEHLKNEMDNQLQASKDAHRQEITELQEIHAKEMSKLTETMETKWEKKLKTELQTLDAAHELEMARMRLRYTNKIAIIQAQNGNVNGNSVAESSHAMEQLKQEHLQMIDDAKKKKFCAVCHQSKLLDLYVCGLECQTKILMVRE